MAQNNQSNRKNTNLLKSTPMSKKEVHLLLDLISSKPILTSKNTKATVNKLKKRAWADIEVEFNAKNEQVRSKDQLSLRWSNLKKTSRKKLKACRGKLELPDREDGIIERVLKLLEGSHPNLEHTDFTYDEVSDSGSYSDTTGISEQRYIGDVEEKKNKIQSITTDIQAHKRTCQGVKFKENILEQNLDMAEYFEKKAKKIDIEIKLLKLQLMNEKRKLLADAE